MQFPPSPFDPAPRRPFSWRPWLFAGGAAVLVVFVAGLLLLARQNEILAWTLSTLEQRLERRLEGAAPESRERLALAFQKARAAVNARGFDLIALERAQSKLMSASRGTGSLTDAEVTELVEALEAVQPRPEAASE